MYIMRFPLQVTPDEDGLETSVLGLRFKVREKHFKASGDLKVRNAKFEFIYLI